MTFLCDNETSSRLDKGFSTRCHWTYNGVKDVIQQSRDAFDGLLTIIGSLLSEDHVLPKSMYDA
jgi:hypothetical protein